MTDIAEIARVSRASIYNFFDSKDNLRRTIIRDFLEDSIGKVHELLNKQRPRP